MAYLAFQEIGGAAIARRMSTTGLTQPVHDAPATRALLNPLEWTVVTMAQRDRLSSVQRPGRLATFVRALFKQPNPMLADERLEALRRMAVLTWHYGYTVPSAELRAFLQAGFTPDQYETIADSIGAARASAPRR